MYVPWKRLQAPPREGGTAQIQENSFYRKFVTFVKLNSALRLLRLCLDVKNVLDALLLLLIRKVLVSANLGQ